MIKLEIRNIETDLLVRSFEGVCTVDDVQMSMTLHNKVTGKQVHLPFNPPQEYYYVTEKINGL